jgi:hypothetical protein
MGEEELAVRYFGQYAKLGRQVYPGWSMRRFGVDGFLSV